MKKKFHVGILMGGFGTEKKVSLNSGKACAKALKEAEYNVSEIIVDNNLNEKIQKIKPNVCFNALHGHFGEDGTIQGYLNALRIPFTHSGVTSSSIAMNKIYTKYIISKKTENLDDPIIFPESYTIKDLENFDPSTPIVVKPISGGSSVGIKMIKINEFKNISNDVYNLKQMIEPHVGNRELTVTILKNRPLTVTEILTNKKQTFYNYDAKYSKGGSLHELPAKIPKTIFDQALRWAQRSHTILGCSSISRTDFRYDDVKKKLYMLEINTQPGMTVTSLVPEQAKFCNITMPMLVDFLIKDAACKS